MSLLLLLALIGPLQPNKTLTALQDELQRNQKEFATRSPAPYFIGYAVSDVTYVQVSASNGAIENVSRNRASWMDVSVRVGGYELDNTHRPDRIRQRRRAAVVKIRRRGRHITQTGDANQYGLRRAQWMKNAVPLKEVASHIDALVARDAAKRLEQLITGKLLWRYHVGVTRQPAVETAARCDERALVERDRVQKGGNIGLPPVRVAELPHRFGVRAQLANDFVRARRHDPRIAEGTLGLAFERTEIPCPV